MTSIPREPDGGASSNGSVVDLLWIPLGAGRRVVRHSGAAYEAFAALVQRRPRATLYHSALEISVPERRVVIEMAPIPDQRGAERGVIVEGPVGVRGAGRVRILRYEMRSWPNGVIPNRALAVESPVVVSTDVTVARRLLDLVRYVPAQTWGRDELRAGEMWTSNSVIAWLLESAGVDAAALHPPRGGRAPGWRSGVFAARRGPPAVAWRARPRVAVRGLRPRRRQVRRIATPAVPH
ncbi:MAG: hypothetical protein ACHQFZ_07830 [Acidimicrobiales bacterium]